MKKYEISINASSKEEADQLALILFHAGYSVYQGWQDKPDGTLVCYNPVDEDVTEVVTK